MAGSYGFVAARAVKCEGTFFVLTYPRGGREKDNRKRIVNRKGKIANRLVSNGEEFSKELCFMS